MEVTKPTDLNTADIDALIDVPGIGEVLAQRIMEARPFDSFDDVVRVKGIGPMSLHKIAPYATVGNGSFPITIGDEKMETKEETRSPELEALAETEEIGEVPADLVPLPPLPPIEPWAEDDIATDETSTEEEVTGVVEEVTADTIKAAGEEETEAPEALLPPPLPVEATAEAIVEEVEEVVEPEEVEPLAVEPQTLEPFTVGEEETVTPPVMIEEKEPETKEPAPEPAKKPARTSVTRGQITWIGFVIFLLTLIAAVALSLGILAGLNNGELSYASPGDVARVSQEVNTLQGRADGLEQSVAGIQSRLDNLEALSGRVDTLETATGDLKTELKAVSEEADALTAQVEDLNTATETLGQQMEEVQAQTGRFQALMDGLRDLLNTIFPTE